LLNNAKCQPVSNKLANTSTYIIVNFKTKIRVTE